MMKNNLNSSNRQTPTYKKALKLNSQPGMGNLSISHIPATIFPLLFCGVLLWIGVPMMKALIAGLWVFTAFLFVLRDKPESFVRRIVGSKKKHWVRKLSRSKSLFSKR